MKTNLIGVLLLAVSVNVNAQDCSHGNRSEVVGQLPSTFEISYKNGTVEKMVIRYTAEATLDVSQDGSASTLSHPIDDRRCYWSTTAKVTRKLCVITNSMGELCEGNSTKRFYITGSGRGEAFNPFKGDFQGSNCNDACGRFNGDYDAAKTAASKALNGVYDSDFKPFLEQIKKKPEIKNVVNH